MSVNIRVADASDAEAIADVLRRSFKDVAERFGITRQSVPTHASNAQPQWIVEELAQGTTYLVAEEQGRIVACACYLPVAYQTLEAQRLAIVPERRGGIVARELTSAIRAEAGRLDAQCIRISILGQHTSLRNWYLHMGFEVRETKTFPYLPFPVQYLELDLSKGKTSPRITVPDN